MAILTLQPAAAAGLDAYLSTSTGIDTNYGTATYLVIGDSTTAGYIFHSLIEFDLSSIPEGATINSAVLSLYNQQDGDYRATNNRTADIYRVKRDWVETETTWNIYSTGNSWQTAGGTGANDYDSTSIGTSAFATTDIIGDEHQFTLTAAKIQEMITGGAFTNNGFLLKMQTEDDDAVYVGSSDNATAALRPKLVINYSPLSTGFLAILQ